jgi:hypothetical protein
MVSHAGLEPATPGLGARLEVIFAVSSRPNVYRIVPPSWRLPGYPCRPILSNSTPYKAVRTHFAHKNGPLLALWL